MRGILSRKRCKQFGTLSETKQMSYSLLLIFLGVAGILDRMQRETVTIAVDGSLYKHHPRLETWMNNYISLLTPTRKVSLSFHYIFEYKQFISYWLELRLDK